MTDDDDFDSFLHPGRATTTVTAAIAPKTPHNQIERRENLISQAEDLLVYECDAYTIEKNLPNIVVLPKSTEEVVAVVRACAIQNIPIIPRGAGTSLSGGVLAIEGGVMIALTRMNRVLQVDYEKDRKSVV